MTGIRPALWAIAAAMAVSAAAVAAADIVRRQAGDFPIAASVIVPPGTELVFLSGTLADVADQQAPAGSVERLGDTQTQTRSVLGKLARTLEEAGLTIGDVIKMNVFLVGDPRKGGTMDFAGLMRAYTEFFGNERQPNLPARTTVQVAGLPVPGALVEIEVVAARHR